MNAKKRRELLRKIDEIDKLDGMTDFRTITKTFCESFRELLMDSVYIEIPQDADVTAEPEVETADA